MWVVARQDAGDWRFLGDGGRWTRNWHEACLFASLHQANDRCPEGAAARLAALVYQLAVADDVVAQGA